MATKGSLDRCVTEAIEDERQRVKRTRQSHPEKKHRITDYAAVVVACGYAKSGSTFSGSSASPVGHHYSDKIRVRLEALAPIGGKRNGCKNIVGACAEPHAADKVIKTEPGGSSFVIQEIQKIDDVIKTLDDLWFFICRGFTGKFEELIKNDAAMLMEFIKESRPRVEAPIDEKFIPSDGTKPAGFRNVIQNGEKSVYVENNTGTINIS